MTGQEWLGSISAQLKAELNDNRGALPPGFNATRFSLNCMTLMRGMLKDKKKRDALLTVERTSIVECLMKGAYLGLDFFNGECYAIPYEPSYRDLQDAQRRGAEPPKGSIEFRTDYKGEIKLCKKYSKIPIRDIFAKIVKEGDEFYEEVDGGFQKIYFRPVPWSDAPIVGVFACVTYQDGTMGYETMSKADVDRIRDGYSRAADKGGSPWEKSYGEMAKKTVLRRLCKVIDLDFDNIEQAAAFQSGGDANYVMDSMPDVVEELGTRKVTAGIEQIDSNDVYGQIQAAQKRQQVSTPPQKQPEPEAVKTEAPVDESMMAEDFAAFEEQYSFAGTQ